MNETLENLFASVSPREFIRSEKNGSISIYRIFGSPRVTVGGCFQSGPYIDQLFRIMIARIPKKQEVKRVLLLGLGGGGALREIHARFPNAHITAVEYDPVMVEIAKTIYLKPKDLINVDIITDDARVAITQFKTQFDFIIVDLFVGRSLSPLLETDDFVKQLVGLLDKDGYMAMNFFRQKKSVAPVFDRYFSRWEDLEFNTNQMAVYRHFGRGHCGDQVPVGYTDKRQSPTFLKRIENTSKSRVVGRRECLGLHLTAGPFGYEEYITDEEPVSESSSFLTWVHWQPYTTKKKHGWFHTNPLIIDRYQKGIGVINEQNKDSYWKDWSDHAIRHRTKWLKDDRYEMADVGLEEFTKAYHATKRLNWFTRTECMWLLKFHMEHYPEDVRLFGARDKKTGEIIAGLAVIQYKDIQQSLHTTSFIHKNVRQTAVGVGLIDHWYKQGIEEGIRFFNFGNVWKKGDTYAWKGYSKFKRQFNLHLILYPKPLAKFVWRKK